MENRLARRYRCLSALVAVFFWSWTSLSLAAGSVSGQVTDSVSTLGIEGMPVCLFEQGNGVPAGCGVTGPDGNYTTADVPDGDYLALTIARTDGYVREFYPGVYVFEYTGGAELINIAGGTVPDIDFALEKGFTISGNVSHRLNGVAVIGALACVRRTDGSGTNVCANTDTFGNYVTPGIPVGGDDFTVIVDAESREYISQVYNDVACPGLTCDFGLSSAISVGPDATDINFALDLANTASIGGTVTDAETGLPVSPVAVDVIDPGTGYIFPIGVTTEPDGTWEITGLEPGSYKVLFNAYGDAEGFKDELYNDVLCDNGSCDFVSEGESIILSAGANTLDVSLVAGYLLSGSVTDSSGAVLPGNPFVDIFDETGNFICCSAAADENGNWAKSVPQAGNYYARIISDSVPGYRPEIWDNVPCDDCDPLVNGTPIKVTDSDISGIDFRLDELTNLIMANGFEFPVDVPSLEVQESLFNYAPDSQLAFSAIMSDGSSLSLLGNKTADGLLDSITSLRLTPADNPIAVVEATFDEFGRPTSIVSIFGTTTYDYEAGNVTVTSTNAAGEGESFVVPEPQQSAGFLSRPQAATCDVSSLFTQKLARGELVFACDNAYLEDRKPGSNVPNSLKMSVNSFDSEIGFWELDKPGLKLKTTLSIDQPEISQHGYEYELNTTLHKEPSYEEWLPCCQVNAAAAASELANNKTFIEEVVTTIGKLEEIANYAKCGFELIGTGGTVVPTCVALVQSYFLGILIDAAMDALTSEQDTEPACSVGSYDVMLEVNGSAAPIYDDVQVVFEKTGVRGNKAIYSQSGLDLSGDANGNLPTLTIGPVPANFEPNSSIESIRAFRSNGDVIAQTGGQLDQSAYIAIGEVLDFRAFDQFFDRSVVSPFSEANREANQHYNCADYSWTLKRNGAVFQTYTHGANNDRFRTQPLEAGEYQLTLGIDSTSTSYGSFSRQFMEGDTPSDDTISPALATLNFTVKATLTVQRVREGGLTAASGGRIVSDPAGIDCGEECSSEFATNSTVELTASDDDDWFFVRWADIEGNPCRGSVDPVCEVDMTRDLSVLAEFWTPCESSLALNGGVWVVECSNRDGQLLSEESFIRSQGEIISSLAAAAYEPGETSPRKNANWRVKVINDATADRPHVITAEPLLPTIKNLYEEIGGGGLQRTAYWSGVYLEDDTPLSAEIGSVEYIDALNYTSTRRVCNWNSLTGGVDIFKKYILVYENGSIIERTNEDISSGQCGTFAEGESVNDLRYPDSIIYQCIKMDKTHDNCPLAPF